MKIADNVLEYYLRNVYWVCGSACGGKSTMAKFLAEKHDFILYNADEKVFTHKKIASPWEQPAMCRHFVDWEWFFNRPSDEYVKWLEDALNEEMSMIIMDLLHLAKEKPVIVDGVYAADAIRGIVPYQRAIFLYAREEVIRRDYFNREDKLAMLDVVNKLSDPKKTLDNIYKAVVLASQRSIERTKATGMKYLIRDTESKFSEMLQIVERHFNL